jgi:hypothetical protein
MIKYYVDKNQHYYTHFENFTCYDCKGQVEACNNQEGQNSDLDFEGWGYICLFVCKKCNRLYASCNKCSTVVNDEKDPDPKGSISVCKFLGLEFFDEDEESFNHRPNFNRETCDRIGCDKILSRAYAGYMEFENGMNFDVEQIRFPEDQNYLIKYPNEVVTSEQIGHETLNNGSAVAKQISGIMHYVGDYDWYWMPLKYIKCPTGPDGGLRHCWYCNRCKDFIFTSDK